MKDKRRKTMNKNLVTVQAVHTHTHTDIFLINNVLYNSCKFKIARKVFCTQNLIRDG